MAVARVYDESPRGARRVLVDRLWPRGIAKAQAPFDEWVKEVAPSTELRKWYGHRPERFAEFARRYEEELSAKATREVLAALRAAAAEQTLVLVTATKDLERSGAMVLMDVLNKR
ncbi:MAG: DUF488 family protein [Actinomycetota bacterium]|nr:DUF488 family protein [Actinomycetota bacterium]